MTEVRRGCQTPTRSVVIPYTETKGQEAIEYYNQTKRHTLPWQENLTAHIMAIEPGGLWVHSKFGFSVSRRNGKSEILAIREMHGLEEGEKILYTAHRTTTSHGSWETLKALLDDRGYKCAQLVKKEENIPNELLYDSYKAFGLEYIHLRKTGGRVNFRTRSAKGGLGEGYDCLIIDEAQEYTDDQESALKYVVSASKNPQTIMCGTPPTAFSSGTVFTKLREEVLHGGTEYTGWAEWSVDRKTDPNNVEAWYETNPSLGYHLTERKIKNEIGSDDVDFNIQRLGYWIKYNQKSAISKKEWLELQEAKIPELTGKLFAGVKYGHDGKRVALSIAVKTADNRIFVESIDCRPISTGNSWILDFLRSADVELVTIDGANGQQLLVDALEDEKIKISKLLPTVKQIIAAGARFEQAIFSHTICHMDQPSLTQVISNCEKRSIGNNGGFGYRAIMEDLEISLMDSIILAHWACSTAKPKKVQKISY